MNIYKHDLKNNFKGFIFWTIGIIALLVSGLIEFNVFKITPQQDFMKMFDKIPNIVLAVFGMTTLDVSTLGGYFSILEFYFLIAVIIYAVILGGHSISRESIDKTYDFLCTKPIKRTEILFFKVLAGVTYLVLFILAIYLGSYLIIPMLNIENTIKRELFYFILSNFLVGMVFFSFTLFVCSISKKIENGIKVGSMTFFITYFFSIVFDIVEWNKFVKPFTPLKYFEAKDILCGKIDMIYILVCMVLTFIFLFWGFYFFKKRDISA